MAKKTVKFIIGPLSSGHVQKWFENFTPKPDEMIYLFTIHKGVWDNSKGQFKIINCGKTRTRLDFVILYWAVFFFSRSLRPAVTSVHYLSSYGLSVRLLKSDKVLLSCWGSDVNAIRINLLSRAIYAPILERAAWINAPSASIKEKLLKMSGRISSNIIDVFQYGVKLQPALCKEAGKKSPDCTKFVSNRHWSPHYNIDLIIQSFAFFVRDRNVSSQLYIYGKGSESDVARINSLISSLDPQIRSKIVLRGFVDHYTLLNEMKDFDVFISIPKTDGLPLSLLEAMYIGLLPVVNALPVYEEWLSDSCGIIVKELTIENLALALARAHNSYLEMNLSTNREKVISRANFDQNTARFLENFA
ncbi:MAG: glycosyltransferase [Rhodospirillales bacterium]|nr:MAG: glycosyltransferase [Rhodospirillales bacterium]